MRKSDRRVAIASMTGDGTGLVRGVDFFSTRGDRKAHTYTPTMASLGRLDSLKIKGELQYTETHHSRDIEFAVYKYVPETVDVMVYHKLRNGALVPVAIVHLPRIGKVRDMVERAYVLTQHAFDSWYNNPEVTVLMESRSSDIGDVFVCDGLACVCEPVGWSSPGVFKPTANPDFIRN